MNAEPKQIREFGKFRLDTAQKVLWHEGLTVSMPLKELEVLCLLVENNGRLVTKNELIERLWADSFVEENNLSRHIYLLRKTLAERGADKNLIENVPRRGYRFTGEVRDVPHAGFIIEKHTRTQTVIEFEEEEKRREGEEEKKPLLLKISSFPLLLFSSSIILLIVGFLAYQSWRGGTQAPDIKTIAVLPFKAIDGGAENEHQGLGLTDILITRLSNIREITVRPTSAVSSLGGEDPILAGQKLGADAVLEGSIYRAGDKTRVTARLVRVGDGSSLWNGQFEKLRSDEMRLQDEIAMQVTEALRLNLSGSEKNALTRQLTNSADAFELYQKGRLEWNKRSWAGMLEAERLFRNAIDRDPEFALAYAGLADTLVTQSNGVETELAILKALELDPNLAEAHASHGFYQIFHRWNWRQAEESLRKSIALNPNYPSAHHWLAQVLTIQGRHEEAKTAMRRALEINPRSHNFLADLGQIYYFNREYREAENYCLKALEIYPDFAFAHDYLSDIYLKTGEYDKAFDEILKAEKTIEDFRNVPDAVRENRLRAYREKIEKFPQIGIRRYIESRLAGQSPEPANYPVYASYYAFLGDREKTLDNLEKAFEGKGFLTAFVKADPVFDEFRNEPRFKEVLRKMKLE